MKVRGWSVLHATDSLPSKFYIVLPYSGLTAAAGAAVLVLGASCDFEPIYETRDGFFDDEDPSRVELIPFEDLDRLDLWDEQLQRNNQVQPLQDD